MTRPLLQWTDDFLIGIDELDYEHRSLIDDINELHRELVAHADKKMIEDTLGRIHGRMQSHFALEEYYMESHGYPQFVEHKMEHVTLLDDYTEFMNRFSKQDGDEWGPAVEDHLKNWIVDHILNSDKKMAAMAKG